MPPIRGATTTPAALYRELMEMPAEAFEATFLRLAKARPGDTAEARWVSFVMDPNAAPGSGRPTSS